MKTAAIHRSLNTGDRFSAIGCHSHAAGAGPSVDQVPIIVEPVQTFELLPVEKKWKQAENRGEERDFPSQTLVYHRPFSRVRFIPGQP